MLWPTVTELPRHLEPSGDDTFVRDLDERTEPRRSTTSVGAPRDTTAGCHPEQPPRR